MGEARFDIHLRGRPRSNIPQSVIDMDIYRCFIALEVDAATRAGLAERMERVRIDELRVVAPANWHVTLKFLGDVAAWELEGVKDALRLATEGMDAFELSVTGAGYLPGDRKPPRILAAMLTCPQGVLQLHRRIEQAVEAAGLSGVSRDRRAYRPHVTLGRFRRAPHRYPAPERIELPATSWPVGEVLLMRSFLERGGAVYEVLERQSLGGA